MASIDVAIPATPPSTASQAAMGPLLVAHMAMTAEVTVIAPPVARIAPCVVCPYVVAIIIPSIVAIPAMATAIPKSIFWIAVKAPHRKSEVAFFFIMLMMPMTKIIADAIISIAIAFMTIPVQGDTSIPGPTAGFFGGVEPWFGVLIGPPSGDVVIPVPPGFT